VFARARWILLGTLAIAAFLRLYRIDLTWFFLDQLRDVSVASSIAAGHSVPLLGPWIGWTNAYLGPLYFYLIAVPFLFTGHPLGAVVAMALANVVAIALLYRFAARYFGIAAALIACGLFAAFPLAVVSARVLWNPGLIPLFTLVFVSALYGVIVDGRSRPVIAASAALAVLTQLHVTAIALGAVALIAGAIWRPRVRLRDVGLGALAFLVLYSPYAAYEITHRFENVRAFASAMPTAGLGGEPALGGIMRSVATLYRPVLGGFLVAEPWAPWFTVVFSSLHAVEAALFAVGLAVCVYRLARNSPRAVDEPARRALALLLLWVAVPVLLLGTRRTAVWWYYLDLLYPSPFILAAIGLMSLASVVPIHLRRGSILTTASAALVAAIAIAHGSFQVGLQRRIDAQGTIAFDASRLSLSPDGGALGEIATLPFHHRFEILRALVEDFRLPDGDLATRVHGVVLGLPEESEYLARYLTGRRGASLAPAPSGTHALVVRSGTGVAAGEGRWRPVGPYAVLAYEPRIDYESWSYAVVPLDTVDRIPDQGWVPVKLPTGRIDAAVRPGKALVLRGRLRAFAASADARIGVDVISEGPLDRVEARGNGARLSAIGHTAARSLTRGQTGLPLLYWAGETIFAFEQRTAAAANTVLLVAVSGQANVLWVDVWDATGP
jgi:4-amino-4-deoxy-L-arabinose transferase-like glycosyltransferase